jgi:hypothetical protein
MTWLEKPWLLVPYRLLSMPSSWKLLAVLRRPLTLNEPSRPLVPTPFWFDSRTPVESSARL